MPIFGFSFQFIIINLNLANRSAGLFYNYWANVSIWSAYIVKMEQQQRTEIEQIILAEIEKLGRRINELKEFTRPEAPDCAIGRVSRMDAINNRSVFEASMNNTRQRLELLRQVLKTIHDDDFGLCSHCRQSIPFDRLKIRPEIRLCANCLRHQAGGRGI